MKKLITIITVIVCLSFIPSIIYGISRSMFEKTRDGHVTAHAATSDEVILHGISVGPIDVSDLTVKQAEKKIDDFFAGLNSEKIVVKVNGNNEEFPVSDANLTWTNQEILEDIVRVGKEGNIIQRFKEIQDVERDSMEYPLERTYDKEAVAEFVHGISEKYNTKAVDAGMKLETDGNFTYTDPEDGLELDESVSLGTLNNYIYKWNGEAGGCEFQTHKVEARGNVEEYKKVKDVIGEAATTFTNASYERMQNVINGAEKINGYVIQPGDVFSVERAMVPFTQENGYMAASAFVGGKVQDDLGGGICHVSSTLYIAVLKAELEVVERYNHTLRVLYVEPSMDATIYENAKDFKFRNNTDYPIYIDAKASEQDMTISVRLYGVETRDPNREVTYESEVIATTPAGVSYVATAEQPIGYMQASAFASEGMTAALWKVVTVNGEEVERTKVNESMYYPQDETYEVGVSSTYPGASQAMYDAVASGDVNQIYQTMAIYGGW